jgi:DNA-binding MarR family transcriptional regulator
MAGHRPCRIVDRLEEAGLVERQRDPDDRRAWRLVLTAKAQPIYERLGDLAEEMSGEAFSGFSHQEFEAFRAKLARIRENISRAESATRKSA